MLAIHQLAYKLKFLIFFESCLSNLVSGVSGANGRISMNFSRYWEDLRKEYRTRERKKIM